LQDYLGESNSDVDLNKHISPKEFRNVMEQISGKKENILLDIGDMVTLKDLQVE
jgi:hypothetical protein